MAKYDAQGRPITARDPASGVNYETGVGDLPGQSRKNVVVGGERRGGADYVLGTKVPQGLLDSGQDAAYYANLMGEAQRRAKASVPYDTSQYLDYLESRGLGRSSIGGEGIRGIQAAANTQAQQGVMNVQGLQYQARQARINAYLNYLYQSKLNKQQSDQGVFGSLFSIGKVIPFLLAPNPATAAQAMQAVQGVGANQPGGYGTVPQPYDPRVGDDSYAGGY